MIVGLGNPGRSYARHRHNLGFMVVDVVADTSGARWTEARETALTARVQMEGHNATLVKPQTYMNLSGRAVAPILKRLNGDAARMIVVHDDIDLAPGRIRVKRGGGDGGHRGVRSIADSLRFRDFVRIRIGVGRPPEGVSAEEYVLTGFGPEDLPDVESWLDSAIQSLKVILQEM